MLDLSNVRVISSILGQSVALDHFDRWEEPRYALGLDYGWMRVC